LAAGISIPLVIWFFVTQLRQSRAKDKAIKKPNRALAE